MRLLAAPSFEVICSMPPLIKTLTGAFGLFPTTKHQYRMVANRNYRRSQRSGIRITSIIVDFDPLTIPSRTDFYCQKAQFHIQNKSDLRDLTQLPTRMRII